MARDVDEEVLSWIAKNIPTLSQAYLVGNTYIIGKGAEARARMGAKYAVAALELLAEQLEVKKGSVSAATFVAEYCAPLRTLEGWEKSQIQRFGVVATGFASFHRVVRSAGLKEIGYGRLSPGKKCNPDCDATFPWDSSVAPQTCEL